MSKKNTQNLKVKFKSYLLQINKQKKTYHNQQKHSGEIKTI